MEFEVGKWYTNTPGIYAKCAEIKSSGSFKYSERIDIGKYRNDYSDIWVKHSNMVETPLSEIQQYLPEKHPDLQKKDSKGRILKEFKIGEWYTNPNHSAVDKYCRIGSSKIGFSQGKPGYYYNNLMFDAIADKDWNIREELTIYQANDDYEVLMEKVEQPVKETKYDYEVVHCTTEEELIAVKLHHDIKYGEFSTYKNRTGICINSQNKYDGWTQLCNWESMYSCKIYSFQEWCDKFGYENPFNKPMEVNEFKKGDYIVCLPEPGEKPKNAGFNQKGGAGFQANYCFQVEGINKNPTYSILWKTLGENGICDNSVRFATEEEIAEYKRLNKPYDVTTLKTQYYPDLSNHIGRYLKALVNRPNAGGVKEGEYGKIKDRQYADFPSQKNYSCSCALTKEYLNIRYELMPEGFEPNKEDSMEDLLQEANRRYPIGCVINSASGFGRKTIDFAARWVTKGRSIEMGKGFVYYNGQWAEIIKLPKTQELSTELTSLPEKWNIKLSSKEIIEVVGKWQNSQVGFAGVDYTTSNINSYISNGFGWGIREGSIEITFDQFKKWVLKESTKESIPEYVECTKEYDSYFKEGIIYKVGDRFYVALDNNFKPSTKEAFDAQNSEKETFFIRYTDEITEELFNQLKVKLDSLYGNFTPYYDFIGYKDFSTKAKFIRSRDNNDNISLNWCLDNNPQNTKNEKTIWDFIDKPVDMKEEFKVGDWVHNAEYNEILRIKEISENRREFTAEKPCREPGRYYYSLCAETEKYKTRKALPHEIPMNNENWLPQVGEWCYYLGKEAGGLDTVFWKKGKLVKFSKVGLAGGWDFLDHSGEKCSNLWQAFRKATAKEVAEVLQHNLQYPKTMDEVFPKEQIQQQLTKIKNEEYKNLLLPLSNIY